MQAPPQTPPGLMIKLLQICCKAELLEYVLGDLEEQFLENLESRSLRRARWAYILQAVKFLRPGILKSVKTQKNNPYTMFLHDVKTSFRLVRREKLYSSINVIGLATAFTIALLIFWYVSFETSYEAYNPNADHMVRITMDYLDGETVVDQDCETYHPLAKMMMEEFPQVEAYTHAYELDEVVFKPEEGGKTFRLMRGAFSVDPSFFDLFHYPLISGDPNTIFQEPNEMVFTESSAMQYFGTTDIIGRTIDLYAFKAKVVGIIPDSPPNTHLKVNMLISYKTSEKFLKERESIWNSNDTYTYFKLKDEIMIEGFRQAMGPYSRRLVEEERFENEQIIAQAMTDIHLYSNKSFEIEKNGDAITVFFLLGVAFLVILIAMVNYINLSTSKSLDRAKEVGIRKVIGSSMGQIRARFFTESIVINFISIITTIVLIAFIAGPFKALAGLPPQLFIFAEVNFWLVLAVLFVVSVVLSGSFPAFILARFKPVTILRGKFSHSQTGTILRKGLVIFQFAIALFLLVQTITANEQLQFLRNLDKGANFDQVMVMRTPLGQEMSKFETFRNELSKHSFVKSASLASCVPGLPTSQMGSTTGIKVIGGGEDRNFNFYLSFIDTAYIPTLEMELVAGRNYVHFDSSSTIIVNEEAVRLWGFHDPNEIIGEKLQLWNKQPRVIGVIKNFHQTNIKDNHIPMIFPTNGGEWGEYISVKVSTENLTEQIGAIESQYNEIFPDSPFDFFFLDEEFGKEYEADERFRQVFGTLSIFSLIITCLGLFGLASFTVAKRTKEIGIRKVLGASVPQIVGLISREFIILIVIGMGIAMPLTIFLIQNWLGRYAFRIELHPLLFIVPAFLIVIVALITVWARTFRVSVSNPVESLRDE